MSKPQSATPWSAEWITDWDRLSGTSRMALECMFDGPIPHQAILDELASARSNAGTILPLINTILAQSAKQPDTREA